MAKETIYGISFRCYYEETTPDGAPKYTKHYQKLPLKDVQKWIECYQFTHPECVSITVKMWFNNAEVPQEEMDNKTDNED